MGCAEIWEALLNGDDCVVPRLEFFLIALPIASNSQPASFIFIVKVTEMFGFRRISAPCTFEVESCRHSVRGVMCCMLSPMFVRL